VHLVHVIVPVIVLSDTFYNYMAHIFNKLRLNYQTLLSNCKEGSSSVEDFFFPKLFVETNVHAKPVAIWCAQTGVLDPDIRAVYLTR
jgi:hypothetical protein